MQAGSDMLFLFVSLRAPCPTQERNPMYATQDSNPMYATQDSNTFQATERT